MRRVPSALEILFWILLTTLIVIAVLAMVGPYIKEAL